MGYHRVFAIAAAAAALFATAAAPAGAATRYAEPTSTDVDGSCSSLQPCRLDHAVGGAAAGDTVVVRPGTYDVTYDLASSAPIAVRGLAGAPRPVLRGGTTTNGSVLEMSGGGSLRHLRLETSESLGSVLDIEGVAARDLEIYTPNTVGANVRDASGGTVLSDSVVRATGASPAIETKDGKTDGVIKLLNVTLYAPDPAAAAVKVKQAGADGTLIRNAVIRGGAADVRVYKGSAATVDHSNLRPSLSAGYVDGGSNKDADPLFADAAAGNLRPLDGSPLIDAGVADENLGVADVDGYRRVLGAAPDIGAYEFVPPGTADPFAPLDAEPVDEAPGSGGDGAGGDDLAPPAAPKPGKRMGVEPVKGVVRVRPPGGDGFVDLDDEASVPVGSTVDASRGVVELTTARDASGEPQTGRFWGGRFRVTQSAATRNYTELTLTGGNFAACKAHAKVSAAGRPAVRKLWGRDHGGRFRTRGRGGQATVRGTRWLTADRCDGTLFKVTAGAIDVKPRGRRRVRLDAGERLLAKLRG